MTLSTQINKVQYTCNGTTDTFPYTFKIIQSADLYVIYTDLAGEDTQWTESTEYTVTAVGEETGGNVVVETIYVPASGTQLTIYRDVPLTQDSDYVENDPFHADTLETDLDRMVMIMQQLDEIFSRVFQLKITDGSDPDMTIPNLADRAETILGFDENGDLTVYDNVNQLIGTGTDNSIVRYDGDTQYVQDSLVFIDDAGNVTGINNLTVDGVITGYATTTYVNGLVTTVSGDIVSYVDNSVSNISTSSTTISGAPSSDHSAEGMKIDAYTAGENLVFGNFVYRKSDGKFWKADKGASTTMPVMAIALATINSNGTGLFLLNGVVRDDSWGWTSGALLYVGASGAITDAAPSSTGEQLQIVGIALTATTIRFDPEYTVIEVA